MSALKPLKRQTLLENPEVVCFLDEAYFKNEKGDWVQFWKDGHWLIISTQNCHCCNR